MAGLQAVKKLSFGLIFITLLVNTVVGLALREDDSLSTFVAPPTMQELFTMPAASTSGACKDATVAEVLKEARFMLGNAIEKNIDKFKSQRPKEPASEKVLSAARLAVPLLGVDAKDIKGDRIDLSFDSQAQLNRFRENYNKALTYLNTKPYRPGKLACNDELVIFTKNTSPDDRIAGEYSIPQWKIAYKVYEWEVKENPGWDPAKGPCARHVPGGVVWGFHESGAIILCEDLWHTEYQSIIALQDELKDLPAGTSIDEMQTPAGTFVHEMMHFVSGGEIVDVRGADNKKAYGFDKCKALPNDKKDDNADNYKVFATAAYLDEIDWSTGVKPSSSDLAACAGEDDGVHQQLWPDL